MKQVTLIYIKVCGLAIGAMAINLCSVAQPAKKPNIVFVFADQYRSMDMGCYGSDAVNTPNFDRLAKEGVRFTNAISTSPICSPYRAMLLTSNHMVKNGIGSTWATSGAGPWRGIRTKQYTYARKSQTKEPWMLFDNKNDPYQYNNLVDNPEYAGLVKRLDDRTNELLVEAGDPENPEFFIKRIQDDRKRLGLLDDPPGLIPTFVEPGSTFREFLNDTY